MSKDDLERQRAEHVTEIPGVYTRGESKQSHRTVLKRLAKKAAKLTLYLMFLAVMLSFSWWVQNTSKLNGSTVAFVMVFLSITLGIYLKKTWEW